VAVTAPTGIAAINIGGQTVHAFAGEVLKAAESDDTGDASPAVTTSTAGGAERAPRERKPPRVATEAVNASSVLVTGLAREVTDEELLAHFAPAGSVVRAFVATKRPTRRGVERGWGVVKVFDFKSFILF
jgi:hypothetical protein